MTGSALKPLAAGLGTTGISQWILNNAVPLLLLIVALLLLYLGGGKGDNAGVMRRIGGVFVALAIIGLADLTSLRALKFSCARTLDLRSV